MVACGVPPPARPIGNTEFSVDKAAMNRTLVSRPFPSDEFRCATPQWVDRVAL